MSMPWIYALIGLVVGVILGVVITRVKTPNYKQQKNIQKDLDAAKFALEQQRQELADHFAQSAELLDTLGKDYTKLYQHMAKTSVALLPNVPEQDNPFAKQLTQAEDASTHSEDLHEQAPKDYANSASGLLRTQEKEIIHSSDVIHAQKA